MWKKKSIKNQKYENYWKLTLEYSDIFGERFNNVLQMMVDFIDENNLCVNDLTEKLYDDLQITVNNVYKKVDMGSTRKSLNQFVKLGFIQPYLKGYHKLTKQFLKEPNREKKRELFSRIIYENSKFNSAVTTCDDVRQVNFLIKTLAYSGPLTEEDICALISLKDITNIGKGFLTRDELETQKRFVYTTGFDDRKYNQKSYLFGIAKRLTGVFCRDKTLSLDPENLPDSEEIKSRDPYLHSLFKKALKDESIKLFGKVVCVFRQKEYTSYVASHIKPFNESNPDEQYNVNNGLLLSRDIDILFDKFDLTFDKFGNPIFGKRVSQDLRDEYKLYKLDERLLTSERLKFLEIHNAKFNEKNKI